MEAIVLLGILCAASSVAVKVEEQVLLAKSAGAICMVSPTGVHFAAVIAKGSRAAVVYDGVESKRFDAILSPSGAVFLARPSGPPGGQPPYASPVVFSPDGEHYAYAAHDGDDYVVMVDGKELARGRWEESSPALGPFAFSPAGNHFYFGVQSRDTSDPKAGFHLQVDDKVGPTSRYPTTSSPDSNDAIVFSPDGAHYAYIGSTTRDQPDVKWAVVGTIC